MEILLIACMLAWTAGAQSEQSKLGISPAQRAILKEQARHEKAVQRIADKHGVKPVGQKAGLSPWKEAPTVGRTQKHAVTGTFLSGYRSTRPAGPPLGQRVGAGAGSAVTWTQDTSRNAWRAYRDRRSKTDPADPAIKVVPLPPAYPPAVPPIPNQPPTAGADGAPTVTAKPDSTTQPGDTTEAKPQETAPKAAPAKPESADETPADTTTPTDTPAATPGGAGRMAAEVTYESVMEESDELAVMCEDDVRVYDRIRDRAEREIGRGDDLITALQNAGFGPKVIGWVARCKENYSVIRSEVDDLQKNTIAQGEAVVKAKALLEQGQGVYAGIAKDMESVADRDAYISDAVDAEDTQAHTEVYETKAA
jgi:hypothetical protein